MFTELIHYNFLNFQRLKLKFSFHDFQSNLIPVKQDSHQNRNFRHGILGTTRTCHASWDVGQVRLRFTTVCMAKKRLGFSFVRRVFFPFTPGYIYIPPQHSTADTSNVQLLPTDDCCYMILIVVTILHNMCLLLLDCYHLTKTFSIAFYTE